MAYFGGEIAELSNEVAARLINQGSAIMIPDTIGEVNQLPPDLPYRELLFDAGFETIQDIINAQKALSTIKGISPKAALKIMEYIGIDKII
jgi:hypothetical protein